MDSLQDLKKVELFIFDLDGTLIDLKQDAERTRSRLNEYTIKMCNKSIIFKPMLDKINKVSNGNKPLRRKLLKIIDEEDMRSIEASEALPYAKELVNLLKHLGKKVAIVSRNGRQVVDAALEKFSFPEFDLIVARDDANEAKPSPQPIMMVLNKLKTKNAVMIGDHPCDITSGKMAGIFTVAVGFGNIQQKHLKESDYYFENIGEFYSYITNKL